MKNVYLNPRKITFFIVTYLCFLIFYRLIVDIVIAPWFGLKNLTNIDVMLSHEDSGRMTNDFAIER